MNDLVAPVMRLRADETDLLGQAAELLPEPILIVDVTAGERLRVAAANRAAARLLGEPTLAERFLDELPDASHPESIARHMARCLKTGAPVTCERRMSEERGTRFIRLTLTPLRNAADRLFRIMLVGRDITDERAAEERLNLLELALDELRQAVYLVDADGRVRYASAEAARALQYSPADLLNMTVADLDVDYPPERWRREWKHTKEKGSITAVGRSRRKDGTLFPVEIVASYIEYQHCEYVIAIVQDITARRRVEQELHTRAEEFRALVENSPDVVVRYDRECRRVYANPAMLRLAGVPGPEVLGKVPSDEGPVLTQPASYEHKIRQVLSTGEPQELLFHGAGSRGPFWAQARFVPEHDTAGRITSVLAIGHDVTRLIEAQQDLRRLNRELRALGKCSLNLIRAEDEESLLREICKIVCDDAGYRLAWVGYAELDARRSIRPIAWAGAHGEYITEARLSWAAGTPEGEGPAGIAIRTARSVMVPDIANDPRMSPWRDTAQQHGFRSGIALPLKDDDGAAFGVMLIYSSERDALPVDEVRLLEELARDLSFGIVALRNRMQRREAEKALRDSEQKYRDLFLNSPVGLFRSTFEGRFLEVNPAFAAMFGYASPAVMVQEITDIAAQVYADARARKELVAAQLAAPAATPHQARFLRRDGSEFPANLLLQTVRDAGGRPLYIEGIVEDMTESRRAEESMRRLNRALKTLSSGNEALVRTDDEPGLLQRMCAVAVEVGGYRFAWIGTAGGDGRLTPRASAGAHADFLERRQRFDAEDPVADALRDGRARVIHSFDDLPLSPDFRAELRQHDFAACAAFPLATGGDAGVLAIYTNDREAFDGDEVRLLTEMSEDLAYGIRALRARAEREQHLARLRTNMQSTIEALSNTVELRDPYTAGHQRRVGKLALSLAARMGWPEERLQAIYLAGMVHDIGKVAIPAELLSKPGRLTEPEMMLIRSHAEAGYGILKGVEFAWPIASMVHQHHERLDGSGYPLGLKGEEILPEARIIAVCDVVEAMTSHRPYRAALGIEAAMEEIQRGRGTLYDAAVVDACIDLFRSRAEALEQAGDEWGKDLAAPLP